MVVVFPASIWAMIPTFRVLSCEVDMPRLARWHSGSRRRRTSKQNGRRIMLKLFRLIGLAAPQMTALEVKVLLEYLLANLLVKEVVKGLSRVTFNERDNSWK